MQFILRPDFTTRETVSQVSGRGIGLDAVKAAVTSLSGSMTIRSEHGQGTSFEFRLPGNQMSTHVILARAGSRTVAISSRGIDNILYHDQVALEQQGDKLSLRFTGQDYPARTIQDALNITGERRAQSRQPPVVVLFNLSPGKAALLVDRIMNCGQALIKPMGEYVPKVPGVLGVTILADGSVSPVIDMVELLRLPPGAVPVRQRARNISACLPMALVVDDSLSARRSLAQFMQDAGYEVRTARDGIEAFDILRVRKPDILLSDLEMPRMNGLELVGHIRADVSLADLPIIMITSRSAVQHQQDAAFAGVNAFLTKPYSEEELLEQIHALRVRS
jgi:chemosensory pili system protein ChpA (sensor histidine kinase/response regulator)